MELKPIATAIVASTALALSLPLWAADSSEADSSAIESESQMEMDSQTSEDGMSGAGETEEGLSGSSESEEGLSGSGETEEGLSGSGESEEGMPGAAEEGTAESGDAASMDEPAAAAAINPADYDGKEIVTADGEDVGTVSKVVLHNSDNNAYAVVGVGGFLGIGKTEAAIPTSELTLEGDQLVLSPGITKESLESGMKYEEAEFSAFEATPSPDPEMEMQNEADDESMTE